MLITTCLAWAAVAKHDGLVVLRHGLPSISSQGHLWLRLHQYQSFGSTVSAQSYDGWRSFFVTRSILWQPFLNGSNGGHILLGASMTIV